MLHLPQIFRLYVDKCWCIIDAYLKFGLVLHTVFVLYTTTLAYFWWGTQLLLWKLKMGSDWHQYDRWNNQQWKIYLCNTSWVRYPRYVSPAKQANHPSSTSRAPVRLIQWWPALVYDNLDIRKIKKLIMKQGLEWNVVIDVIFIVLTVMSTECCGWISTPLISTYGLRFI
jgi:hypothetical protein